VGCRECSRLGAYLQRLKQIDTYLVNNVCVYGIKDKNGNTMALRAAAAASGINTDRMTKRESCVCVCGKKKKKTKLGVVLPAGSMSRHRNDPQNTHKRKRVTFSSVRSL